MVRESDEEAADYITLLSEVLLGEIKIQNDFPKNQLACDTQLSVWAIVGGAPVQDMSPGSKISIVDRFSTLPQDLQIELGGRLASAFLDAGEDDLANRIARVRDSHRFNDVSRMKISET